MSNMKKQNFLQGAFILVCADLLVKGIGALFKIPLTYVLHEDGMGLFTTAYTMYTFMFVVATAGFPTAISKMVSECVALGKNKEAKKTFTVALTLLSIVGIIGSLILYFGAYPLAVKLGNTRAYLGIMAISPAIFCVALMSAFRGYFQGHQNMFPTAISEVAESLGKLIVGYVLAIWFIKTSVELSAAGAVFGVTCGTLFGLISLVIMYFYNKRHESFNKSENVASYLHIAKVLVCIAVPITIGASVASLTNVVDMMTVMRRLQSITTVTPEFLAKYSMLIDSTKNFTGAINEELANKLYGLYSGYAIPLFNLPLTIITAIAMSVVPSVAGDIAKKKDALARNTTLSAIRITILFALPCAAGLFVLSGQILHFLYNNPLADILLKELSFAIVFVSLLSVTNAILQAYGHTIIPVVNMTIGGIIKVITNYILVGNPNINIQGAPIGTLICYFSIVCLNLFFIIRITKIKIKPIDIIIKPLFSSIIMGVLVYISYSLLFKIHLGMRFSTLISICIGAFAYLVIIFLISALKKEEIAMLPKGDKIISFLESKKLM